MITATARKNIVRALRQALRIRESQAREILETVRNENMLRMISGEDMRTVKAMVSDTGGRPQASLYADAGDGYEPTGVTLSLSEEDVARWNVLSIEEAYAIAGEIIDNAGPVTRAADARIAAETAANDDAEGQMDRLFGPVPENREYQWIDGTVLAAAVVVDHVVACVRLADGTEKSMTMLPGLNDADGTLDFVSAKIGKPARLSVGRLNAFDDDHPANVDRTLPLLSMVVLQQDVPGLARLYSRAA